MAKRPCVVCGDPFEREQPDQVTCSAECREANRIQVEHDRNRRRNRRKRRVRALTLGPRELGGLDSTAPRTLRHLPVTRGECFLVPRPCVYVSCKFNLYLDVSPRTGAIKLNFPDLEPGEMMVSCALDVAENGGTTLDQLATLLNVTRERSRQLEMLALEKIARAGLVLKEAV